MRARTPALFCRFLIGLEASCLSTSLRFWLGPSAVQPIWLPCCSSRPPEGCCYGLVNVCTRDLHRMCGGGPVRCVDRGQDCLLSHLHVRVQFHTLAGSILCCPVEIGLCDLQGCNCFGTSGVSCRIDGLGRCLYVCLGGGSTVEVIRLSFRSRGPFRPPNLIPVGPPFVFFASCCPRGPPGG
jgi:hypothetical protein